MTSLQLTTSDLNQYAPQLKSFAMKFTKEVNFADDLLQDTFVKAIRSFDQFEQGTNLKAWLFMIMRNTFINDYRKTTRVKKFVQVVEDISSFEISKSSTFNHGEGKFAMADIKKALSKLPEQHAIPFIQYFEGYKYHEIAEALDIPIGTVKTRIHLARQQLKKILKNYQY